MDQAHRAFDDNDELIYYFGSRWDVSDVHAARADEKHAKAMSRELSHRMRNMFSVIGGIVAVTGRTRGVRDEADEINDRIQALGRAYEPTLDEAARGTIEIGQATRSVLAPYDPEGGPIGLRGGGVRTDPNVVSLDDGPVDVAVLDVNLGGGETCLEVARKLEAGGVPFLLHTGDLNRQGEVVRALGAEVVPKPTPGPRLVEAVKVLLSNARSG